MVALLSTYLWSALLLLTVSALHPNRAVEGVLFVFFFGKESINFPMDLTSILKTTFIFLTSKLRWRKCEFSTMKNSTLNPF